MSVRVMTSADRAELPNVETIHNYHGHRSDNVRHADYCPHYEGKPGRTVIENRHGHLQLGCVKEGSGMGFNCRGELGFTVYGGTGDGRRHSARYVEPMRGENFTGGCRKGTPLYMETKLVGVVLSLHERNGYHDSDFYVRYWNEEEGRISTYEYASTRGWSYPNSAKVDATPEVVAKAKAWEHEAWKARMLARLAFEREEALAAAEEPCKGDTVRVTRKLKKVPKGTEGKVFWTGVDAYRPVTRYGIKDEAGDAHWVSGHKSLEIVAGGSAARVAEVEARYNENAEKYA